MQDAPVMDIVSYNARARARALSSHEHTHTIINTVFPFETF